MLAYCLLGNVYIVPICIIDGAFSMFSKRGCVPDICPLGVYQEILSLGGYFPIHTQGSRKVMSSLLLVNIKKYIPTAWWMLTIVKSILQWWENGLYSNKPTLVHLKKTGFLLYPIPEIPDDFDNWSGTDRVLKNISGSGRVSGTRWSLVILW